MSNIPFEINPTITPPAICCHSGAVAKNCAGSMYCEKMISNAAITQDVTCDQIPVIAGMRDVISSVADTTIGTNTPTAMSKSSSILFLLCFIIQK